MQKFLIKFFLFLLLLKISDILLSSFFAWSLQSIRRVDDDYGSLNRMYNGRINADIIFIGSSRTYLHIDPEIIQKKMGLSAWNLAMDGSNFDQHKFTLEEYLIHNHPPKIVVFEADLTSLDKDALTFKTEYFLPYSNYSKHTRDLFVKNQEEKLYYWFFTSAFYKQQIPIVLSNYRNLLDNLKSGGYAFEPLSSTTVIKKDMGEYILINGAELFKGQVPSELPTSLPISSPITNAKLSGEDMIQGFEEVANLAEENGVILVLVSPPWLKGSINDVQRQNIINYYKEIDNKYGNTYFLDYSQDNQLSNNLSFWLNIAHLNYAGADFFTQELSNDLLNILSVSNK